MLYKSTFFLFSKKIRKVFYLCLYTTVLYFLLNSFDVYSSNLTLRNSIMSDDQPVWSCIKRLTRFHDQQRNGLLGLCDPYPSLDDSGLISDEDRENINITDIRLKRLKKVLSIPTDVDDKLDDFERASIDTILGTLQHFLNLLDPAEYLQSSEHISLTQDALLIQTYHLLNYRYQQVYKHLYLNVTDLQFNFKDIKSVLEAKIQTPQNGLLDARLELNVRTAVNKPWMQRLKFLMANMNKINPINLGSFLGDYHVTESPEIFKPFLYLPPLREVFDENTVVLNTVSTTQVDAVRVKLADINRSLRLSKKYAEIALFMTQIIEPMEDIASLEFDDALLTNQILTPMKIFGSAKFAESLRTETNPRKFLLAYFNRRLHELGEGIMNYFPKTYFQRTKPNIEEAPRDSLYSFLPFLLLRNIALNLHHANMFKREESRSAVNANIKGIRDLLREIIPYAIEYIIHDALIETGQPYDGLLLKDKSSDEIQHELELIIQRYPDLQVLSDFANNLSYLFISHMNVPLITEPLQSTVMPLSSWTLVMQSSFLRALSILGETSKGITQNIKGMLPATDLCDTLEVFRDEFSHNGGLDLELPSRFKTFFSDDSNMSIMSNALSEIQNIYQFFSDYCKSLWEGCPLPSAPTIHGYIKTMLDVVGSLDIPAVPGNIYVVFNNRPQDVTVPPNLAYLRSTFDQSKLLSTIAILRQELSNPTDLTSNSELFKNELALFFPLDADMKRDHNIIVKYKKLVGMRDGIKKQGGISKAAQVQKMNGLVAEITTLLDLFDIGSELDIFMNEFFDRDKEIHKEYKKKKDVQGSDDKRRKAEKTADLFLKTHLDRFGIPNPELWVRSFKASYGYIPTPGKKLYCDLARAVNSCTLFLEKIEEIKSIFNDIKGLQEDNLHWAAIEYHLPQLRDLIDEIHKSIQRIRSFSPGILRNIERQLLNIRLTGNRIAHLNDAISFDKYNTYTRRRDIELVLREIFGFTADRKQIDVPSFIDGLNFFIYDVSEILKNPNTLFHQANEIVTPNTTGTWIVPQNPIITFQEREIARDGDCGFRVLGFTRKRGVELLLENAHNENIRQSVAEDIRMSLLGESLVGWPALDSDRPKIRKFRRDYYHYQQQIDSTRRQLSNLGLALPENTTLEYLLPLVFQDKTNGQIERAQYLQLLMRNIQKLRETNKGIDKFTHDVETYHNFIRSEFQEGNEWIRRGNRWLSYVRNGKGTLYALAQIAGLNIRIWEPDPNHPGDLRRIPLAQDILGQEINLLHTDRLTHFNALDII